ncbi:MAG: hypothetical protein ACLSA6_01530 [Holdemania massiliensis]
MIESIGFTTDFKMQRCVSQYIYISDFVQSDQPQQKMVEYFEHFNLLKISDLTYRTDHAGKGICPLRSVL